MFKDQRMVTMFEYSADNKTVYLGSRGAHGRVKLYNKQIESKLDKPLTRLEITMDYAKSTWMEFKRLFPKLYVYDDLPNSFTGTDLVLALAISEHSEYMSLLNRSKREKITHLLQTDALQMKPDEISYRTILHEILTYGKGIPVEKFEELEDCEEIDFTYGLGEEITGVQEEMK